MSNRHDRRRGRRGSVLILVVALLAVLFVTGIGFLTMTSNDRRSSAAGRGYSGIVVETDAALQLVIAELSRDLWDNVGGFLTGAGGNECWDYPSTNAASFGFNDDAWLASTFPVWTGSGWQWPHISNLSGLAGFGRGAGDTNVLASALEADADRDGINDSRWMLSPSGRFRIAIRVVDLCGMINLNTAGRGFLDDLGNTQYNVAATSTNLEPGWNNTDGSRGYILCSDIAMFVESGSIYGRGAPPTDSTGAANNGYLVSNPQNDFAQFLDNPFIRINGQFPYAQPYRTTDTLALLSYGVKIGPVLPRFEVGWPYTFTAGNYSIAPTSRHTMPQVNSSSFGGDWSMRMFYTATNWTRDVLSIPTTGGVPANGPGTWQEWANIVNAFYGLPAGNTAIPAMNINGTSAHGMGNPHDPLYTRALVAAIVLSGAMSDQGDGVTPLTQQQVEQLVVNLVDFRDTDQTVSRAGANPGGSADLVDTVFNSAGSADGVYGIEPQVFITDLGSMISPVDPYPPASQPCFALELFNPYADPVDVSGWKIYCCNGSKVATLPANTQVAPGGFVHVVSGPVPPGKNYAVRTANPGTTSNPTPTVFSAIRWGKTTNCILDQNLVFGFEGGSTTGQVPAASDIYLGRPLKSGSDTFVVVDQVRFDSTNQFGARKALATWLKKPASGTTLFPYFVLRGDKEWMQAHDDAYKSALAVDTSLNATNSTFGDAKSTSPGVYANCRDGRELPIVAGCWPATRDPSLAGTWNLGVAYAPRTLVRDSDGSIWQCRIGHQSPGTGTFAGDRATYPTRWEKIGPLAAWAASRAYVVGDLAQDLGDGSIWRCAAAHTSGGASFAAARAAQPAYWTLACVNGFDTVGQLHWMMLVGPELYKAGGIAGNHMTARISALSDNPGGTAVNALCVDFANPARADHKMLRNLVRLDRLHNGIDDNGDGVVDDIGEWRQAGKINLNTAPPQVIQALNYYLAPSDSYYLPSSYKSGYLGSAEFHTSIYNYRGTCNGFTRGVGQAFCAPAFTTLGNWQAVMDSLKFTRNPSNASTGFHLGSNSNSTSYAPTYFESAANQRVELQFFDIGATNPWTTTPSGADPTWYHEQRGRYDNNERHFIIDRISDLATTRSDTFLVYILVEEIECVGGQQYWQSPNIRTPARRLIGIVDRSRCSRPPSDSGYLSPEVIARSIATW